MENLTYQQKMDLDFSKTNAYMAEKWLKGSLDMVKKGHLIADMVARHVDIQKKRVLDIGSGDGGVSVAFAQRGAKTVGLDYNPERCKLGRLRAKDYDVKISFFTGNAQNMSFIEGSFDIVICNAVIEHVTNPKRLASEISRILKPKGLLFLDTPSRYSILQLVSDTHYNLFGISIMPKWLAEFYTVHIRKRYNKYDVESLKSFRFLKKTFKKNNIVFLEDANITFLLDQISGKRAPLIGGVRQKTIALFNKLHLSWLLKVIVTSWLYKNFITSGWSFIGKKEL